MARRSAGHDNVLLDRKMLGSLRQHATLYTRVTTPDGGGGGTLSWNAIGSTWIRIVPQSASESLTADAPQARVATQLVMRRNASVQAGMRVVAGARLFRIEAVLDQGDWSPFITLACEELQ
jgi:SPP1 family predicted phage head-tail adaptor